MTRENFLNELKDKCPNLFNAELLNEKRCATVRYIETKEGWDNIIETACTKIEALNIEGLLCVQIKEKFGGLRLYCNFETPEVSKIIREAESLAWQTCEMCGTTENVCLQGVSWTVNWCKDCYAKYKSQGGLC
jgi:hypothetical protein